MNRYKRRLVCNPCEKQKLKESKKFEAKIKNHGVNNNMKRSISVDTGLASYGFMGIKRNPSSIDPALLSCVAKELEQYQYESPKKKFFRQDSNSYTFGPDSDLDTLVESPNIQPVQDNSGLELLAALTVSNSMLPKPNPIINENKNGLRPPPLNKPPPPIRPTPVKLQTNSSETPSPLTYTPLSDYESSTFTKIEPSNIVIDLKQTNNNK